jgi:hypothetical protein
MPEPVMELTDSVPAPAAAPSPDATPAAPAADAPAPAAPAADKPADAPADKPAETPAAELFELPDGRKVDAATLQKEWKENFYPEYTRKSQKLAAYEGVDKPNITKTDEPEWKKPDYVPKTYGEVIELATQEAQRQITATAQAERERVANITAQVNAEVAELKKADPQLDENALFVHATKYGFQNLKAAHANMVDMRGIVARTEQTVIKNLKTREADPVSTGASGAPTTDEGYDPNDAGQFSSALEFFQSRLKK